MAFFTAPSSASTVVGLMVDCAIAVSGSFKPLPVKVQTILLPSGILPEAISFKAPAREAAEAGSQKIPS